MAVGPGWGDREREQMSGKHALGTKCWESTQASGAWKRERQAEHRGCRTSRNSIPRTQSSQFPPLGSSSIVLTGFHHVFQEVRNSILQKERRLSFPVSSQRWPLILQGVAKVKEDGFGNLNMTIGTLSRFSQNVATDDDKRGRCRTR